MEFERSHEQTIQPNQPQALRDGAILDFLKRHQAWSEQASVGADARFAPRLQRLKDREALQINRMRQRNELQQLRLGTLVEPETYERPLREAENTYHLEQAEHMASYIAAVTTDQPRFSGIKKRFAEVRQHYHTRIEPAELQTGCLRWIN